MRDTLTLLLALASGAGLAVLAESVQAQRDAPIVLRDTLQLRLSASDAVPLANGDLYLSLATPSSGVVLVRQGSDGTRWRRQPSSVDGIAVHDSGGSTIVRRTDTGRELVKVDPDGRVQWVAPFEQTPAPSFGAGNLATGPGSLAGFINASQYCERTSADLPLRCVTLPDHSGTLSPGIRIDAGGTWVYYRSTQDQIRVARIPRDGGAPVIATLAGENRVATPLAANAQAAWLRVIESGTTTMDIVRVSAAGVVTQTVRNSADVQAAANGDDLIAAFASPSATVERLDADLAVVATAPFNGRPANLALGATGRVCVIGVASPQPGPIVLRCYGAGLQAEPERVLSDDADVGCPCAVAVGEAGALAHWGDRIDSGGGGGLLLQSVVQRVPQDGPTSAPQPVDRIDAPLAMGSVAALARSSSGDVAIFGSARALDGSSLRGTAWAARLPSAGGPPMTYKGTVANGEPIVSGTFDGGDLLGWAQWTPLGAFFSLPPVVLRLHRIPSGSAGTVPATLPSPVAGQRRTNAVFRIGERWIVAGTDLVETGSGSLRYDAYVLAHDASGAIEWQRRYVGGERGRPYILPTASGLVVAHSWRDTEGAPDAPTQCVVEGLSASGSMLWARSGASRRCGAIAASESADAALVTAFDASSSELILEVFSSATGATLGTNTIASASGTSPMAVARVAGGWRVLSQIVSTGVDRLETTAFDALLALDWRTSLDTPYGEGRPAMAALSGGRVDVAVVSGDRTRSLLSRWRVAADGSAALIDRVDADTAGFNTLADARNFAVALVAVDADESLMAATLFEAGGNQVVRVSSRSDLMFEDSFD